MQSKPFAYFVHHERNRTFPGCSQRRDVFFKFRAT